MAKPRSNRNAASNLGQALQSCYSGKRELSKTFQYRLRATYSAISFESTLMVPYHPDFVRTFPGIRRVITGRSRDLQSLWGSSKSVPYLPTFISASASEGTRKSIPRPAEIKLLTARILPQNAAAAGRSATGVTCSGMFVPYRNLSALCRLDYSGAVFV